MKHASDQDPPVNDEQPQYRSYFELLEAKYGDSGNAEQASGPAEQPAAEQAKRAAAAVARQRAPRQRRPSGQLWVVMAFLLLLAGAGVATYVSKAPILPDRGGPDSAATAQPSDTAKAPPDAASQPPTADLNGDTNAPKPEETQSRADASEGSQAPSAGVAGDAAGVNLETAATTSESQDRGSDPVELPAPELESAESRSLDPENPNPTSSNLDPPTASPRSPPSSSATPTPDPALAPEQPTQRAQEATEGTAPEPPPTSPQRAPDAASDETVTTRGETTRARKVFSPQPKYPESARLRGDEGTVTVTGRVTSTGTVKGARVLEGEGISPEVDRAALEAFRTWQFLPAKRDGEPVESTYRVAFRFTLEDETLPDRRQSPASNAGNPIPQAQAPETRSATDEPFEFGGDFEAPVRLASPLPAYPRSAWASGVTGDVVLEIVVDRQGSVGDIAVLRGLPNGISEAAVTAVKRWRFSPAKRNGEAVMVKHRVTLRFAP